MIGAVFEFVARNRECRGQRLDHARGRAHHRSRLDHETIDLGNEPPLSVDGGTGDPIDRRRVSAQWFSGTILTGLCGAALMGGAVFASLDGETNFATLPDRIESVMRGSISGGDKLAGTRKSDRLPPAGESNGAAPGHPRHHHEPCRRPRGGARASVSCASPPT